MKTHSIKLKDNATKVRCESFGATDKGRFNLVNEDQFMVAYLKRFMSIPQSSVSVDGNDPDQTDGILLLVADGVGAGETGQEASALVASSFRDYVLEEAPWNLSAEEFDQTDFLDILSRAAKRCEGELRNRQGARAQVATTLTAACIFWPDLYLLHVGNSSCYRLRNGELVKLSRDHSVAERFVRRGLMRRRETANSNLRHLLWNTLGGRSVPAEPQLENFKLRGGDRIVLCTDGASEQLAEDELARELRSHADAEEASKSLLRKAKQGGGQDDSTVICAFFEAPIGQTSPLPTSLPGLKSYRRLEPTPAEKSTSPRNEVAETELLASELERSA